MKPNLMFKPLKILTIALYGVLLHSTAFAQQLPELPEKPQKSQIPKYNSSGERVKGITLRATGMFLLPNGQILPMYGFIVGQMNGTANVFYWNDKLGVECEGKTTLQSDRSGTGVILCNENGAPYLELPIKVTAEKYLQRNTIATMKIPQENGTVFAAAIAWKTGRFPNPSTVFAAIPN